MPMEYQPLRAALLQLGRAMERRAEVLRQHDHELAELLRTAAIQCFEFSYEQGVMAIRRVLEARSDRNDPYAMDFKEVLREASDMGLIEDETAWFEYRRLRNRTSHTYMASVAEEVFEQLPAFFKDGLRLLEELEKQQQ
jgi:nucleotidyltransferase substrate binding protein (TIGR01987 family)